jgi:hypothetical protein
MESMIVKSGKAKSFVKGDFDWQTFNAVAPPSHLRLEGV